MKTLIWTALLSLTACVVNAQYSIDRHKVAGGGGASSGGIYEVGGTMGQADAGGPLSGGPVTGTNYYSLTGGFWALINVVQMPGVPKLVIVPNGSASVKLRWPDPATNSYTLQQNANLSTTNWVTSGYTVTNGFGTNFCTITPPVGNLFFRLKQ